MHVRPDRAPAAAEQLNRRKGIGNMQKEEIKNLFMNGIDCSQVVAGHFAGVCQIDCETMRKVSACFGGGMWCGETCGAVTGALMVLGISYGTAKEGDSEQKNIMMTKLAEFKQAFGDVYPSCICKELLGHNIADPEEFQKILDEGLLFNFCPGVVEDTIKILEKML